MQSANFFFSENVLLTQENNLDNLNVIIGTIDPFLQNQKVISKIFFFKNKKQINIFSAVNPLEKIKKKFFFQVWNLVIFFQKIKLWEVLDIILRSHEKISSKWKVLPFWKKNFFWKFLIEKNSLLKKIHKISWKKLKNFKN